MGIKISIITTITRLSSKIVVLKIDYKSLIEHQPCSKNVKTKIRPNRQQNKT